MAIGFNFDANSSVGYGHLNRCNEIAKELKKRKQKTIAIVGKNFNNSFIDLHFDEVIKINSSFSDAGEIAQICIEKNIPKLLIDHYQCDVIFQETLTSYGIMFGQYDFKCEGSYLGKFVININPCANKGWYKKAVLNREIKLLCGAKFAIINPNLVTKPLEGEGVFVCMGGGNDNGVAASIINQVSRVYKGEIHLVASSLSSSVPLVEKLNNANITTHVDLIDYSEIIKRCHYAIVSAGTLSYEMAYIGIPFSCGYFAENQIKIANSWQQSGLAHSLGCLTSKISGQPFKELLNNISLKKPRKPLIDGLAAKRIAEVLLT